MVILSRTSDVMLSAAHKYSDMMRIWAQLCSYSHSHTCKHSFTNQSHEPTTMWPLTAPSRGAWLLPLSTCLYSAIWHETTSHMVIHMINPRSCDMSRLRNSSIFGPVKGYIAHTTDYRMKDCSLYEFQVTTPTGSIQLRSHHSLDGTHLYGALWAVGDK